MALTPKERADFDQIVARLRLEEGQVEAIDPKRRSTLLLLSLIATVLVFGLGVAMLGNGALGPILIIGSIAGCGVLACGYRDWAPSAGQHRGRR